MYIARNLHDNRQEFYTSQTETAVKIIKIKTFKLIDKVMYIVYILSLICLARIDLSEQYHIKSKAL